MPTPFPASDSALVDRFFGLAGLARSIIQIVLYDAAAVFCEEVANRLGDVIRESVGHGEVRTNWRTPEEEVVIDEGLDVDAYGNQVGLRLLSPLKLVRDGFAGFDDSALLPA